MLLNQLSSAVDPTDTIAFISSYIKYTSNDLFFCSDALGYIAFYFYDKFQLFDGSLTDFLLGFFVFMGSKILFLNIYIGQMQDAEAIKDWPTYYENLGKVFYTIVIFEPIEEAGL